VGVSFGLSPEKIIVIMLIAVFIIGPERLPRYAQKLGELVRRVKSMANTAKDRVRDEMGDDFDPEEWKKLDPRQYDPRRIIKEALLDDEPEPQVRAPKPAVAAPITPSARPRLAEGQTAPYDAEAT